jgi:hypothetical protein
MIAQNAAAALARTADIPRSEPHDVHIRRLRARMTRDVAVMLDVPTLYVTVGDDPARCWGGRPGHLITVHDPDEPTLVYRLVPETGHGRIYLLLDECPGCTAPAVPMATISGLADLGRHLATTRPAPPSAADPDDGDRDSNGGGPDVPLEFFGDPTHHPSCPVGRE